MKPSEKCRAAGLKGLAELSRIVGESEQTINNWSKNKPNVFDAVIMWAASQPKEIGMKTRLNEPLFVAANTKKEAIKDYETVTKVVKVSGGYMLFPFQHQYDDWKRAR